MCLTSNRIQKIFAGLIIMESNLQSVVKPRIFYGISSG